MRVAADGAELVSLARWLAQGPTQGPTQGSTDAPTQGPTQRSTDAPTQGPTRSSQADVSGRRIVGLAGPPGAGKSTLAGALARLVESSRGGPVAVVPMDGFHLADAELARQGLLDRKGAPETFDAWGYASLLRRLRERPAHPVYAPAFDRTVEQPVAGAVAVPADVSVVITEGNYLLLDRPEWAAARAQLDEVWFVLTDDELRAGRLVSRAAGSGKSENAARAWVDGVDEPNARLVRESRWRADREVDLTAWVATR